MSMESVSGRALGRRSDDVRACRRYSILHFGVVVVIHRTDVNRGVVDVVACIRLVEVGKLFSLNS